MFEYNYLYLEEPMKKKIYCAKLQLIK